MNDPKSSEDCIGTIKSFESKAYHGEAQGWTPIFNHQRTCHVWQEIYKGYFQSVSVNTETLIVRPVLKTM